MIIWYILIFIYLVIMTKCLREGYENETLYDGNTGCDKLLLTTPNDLFTEEIRTMATGTIMCINSSTIPDGFLLCDGSDFDMQMYDKLAIILPSGKTPDFRGFVLAGKGSGNYDQPLGNEHPTGSKTATLSDTPKHRHPNTIDASTFSGTSSKAFESDGDYWKIHVLDKDSSTKQHDDQWDGSKHSTVRASSTPWIDLPRNTGYSGGGEPHNNIQKNKILNFIIKT